MTTLYLIYDSSSEGGEHTSSNPYSSRTDARKTVNFKSFYRNSPTHRFFYDSLEVDDELAEKDVLYLAVVRYTTGDSFGTSYGNWHIVGAYGSNEEADEALVKALAGDGYKPWEGYFERLERTEIYDLDVRE